MVWTYRILPKMMKKILAFSENIMQTLKNYTNGRCCLQGTYHTQTCIIIASLEHTKGTYTRNLCISRKLSLLRRRLNFRQRCTRKASNVQFIANDRCCLQDGSCSTQFTISKIISNLIQKNQLNQTNAPNQKKKLITKII